MPTLKNINTRKTRDTGKTALEIRDLLKDMILSQYKSVKAFATQHKDTTGYDAHSVSICMSAKQYPSVKVLMAVAKIFKVHIHHKKVITHSFTIV